MSSMCGCYTKICLMKHQVIYDTYSLLQAWVFTSQLCHVRYMHVRNSNMSADMSVDILELLTCMSVDIRVAHMHIPNMAQL